MASSSPATSCRISSCSDSLERGPSGSKVIGPPSGIWRPPAARSCIGPLIIRRGDRGCLRLPQWLRPPFAYPSAWDDEYMSRARVLVVLLASLVALVAGMICTARAQAQRNAVVLSLTLNGVVDPFVANYIRSGIDEAEADGEDRKSTRLNSSHGSISYA